MSKEAQSLTLLLHHVQVAQANQIVEMWSDPPCNWDFVINPAAQDLCPAPAAPDYETARFLFQEVKRAFLERIVLLHRTFGSGSVWLPIDSVRSELKQFCLTLFHYLTGFPCPFALCALLLLDLRGSGEPGQSRLVGFRARPHRRLDFAQLEAQCFQ